MSSINEHTNQLKGQPSEVRMVVEIKRAATGKTEIVNLIGKIEDTKNGSNTHSSGTERGN